MGGSCIHDPLTATGPGFYQGPRYHGVILWAVFKVQGMCVVCVCCVCGVCVHVCVVCVCMCVCGVLMCVCGVCLCGVCVVCLSVCYAYYGCEVSVYHLKGNFSFITQDPLRTSPMTSSPMTTSLQGCVISDTTVHAFTCKSSQLCVWPQRLPTRQLTHVLAELSLH